jgi:hypothetical protein
MKLLNWAKEKLREVSDRYERKQREKMMSAKPKPKLAPIVQPPTREDRKEQRWRMKFHRHSSMPTMHGGPVLTSERLRKNISMCSPSNLLVQPRYRREEVTQ